MEPAAFDYGRFDEWRQEREERTAGFWRQRGGGVLFVPHAYGDYTRCRTPAESLRCQLDAISATMDIDTDYVPFLEPWFGVGVFAAAFGCPFIQMENESPQTRYGVFNSEQAAALEPVPIDRCAPLRLVLEAIGHFIDATGGRIPISCTDTQSPFDTASLVWESSDFFVSMATAPETVHRLLEKITRLKIEFSRLQAAAIGERWARPGHIMPSVTAGPGLSISEDDIVMISPEHYREFCEPYNRRLAEEFGGLAVHSCGNYERQLGALLQTPGLIMVDAAFSPALDPDPNRDYEFWRDTLKGTGIILQARMHLDWPRILPRLYHPDLKLVLQVPPPAPGEGFGVARAILETALAQAV